VGVDVRVEGLTKSFGRQLIWGDVTLTIPAGEICVMLGPSGTGKSVFLKTLIGLLKPDRGHIHIEGVDIATCSERQLYEVRKRTSPPPAVRQPADHQHRHPRANRGWTSTGPGSRWSAAATAGLCKR
jgi:ABC-type oligopeptide transport system ATPase subunit